MYDAEGRSPEKENSSSRRNTYCAAATFLSARPQLLSGELTLTATATTAQRLGEALALRGEHGRSADAFARAVTANKTLFGVTSAETVESLTGLGLALLEQVGVVGKWGE